MYKEFSPERSSDHHQFSAGLSRHSGDIAHERGDNSEQNVLRVLTLLPFVQQVTPTEKNGREDHRGCDAFVVIYPGRSKEDLFRVEVKSSGWGIHKFKKSIADKFHILLADVDMWLINKHHVVINGQDSPQRIAESFTKSLQQITGISYQFDPETLR